MDTEFLCPDWPKCQSSINQATQLVVDVEGLPGEHVNKIANTIFDLAQGINESWDELWEDGEFKSISQQQSDVLIACIEVQKSVKHLVQMFRFRQAHDNREVIEARQNMANRPKPKKPRQARPPPRKPRGLTIPTVGATAHVITSDLKIRQDEQEYEEMIPSGTIDDHPMFIDKDIKEEPIDEMQTQPFVDKVIKLEEEVDEIVAKRPKSNDSVVAKKQQPTSYAGYDEEMEDDEDEEEELNDEDDVYQPSGSTPTLRSTLKQFESTSDGTTVAIQKKAMCDVCGQFTVKYFTTPRDPALSKICYSNLVDLTPKERARVECLKQRKGRAIVCESHYKKNPPKTFSSVHEKRAKMGESIKKRGTNKSNEHRWAQNWQHEFHKAHPTKRTGLSRAVKSAGTQRVPPLRDGQAVEKDFGDEPIALEEEQEIV